MKRSRKILIKDKEFGSLESAAKEYGVSRNTLDYRLSKGWSPEQAVGLEPPPEFASRTPGIPVVVEGHKFATLKEAAKYYNRAYTHLIEMIKKGASIEQALGLVRRNDTLEAEYPELAKQWHPTKNGSLNPKDVTYGSGIRAWWKCSNNHEWEAVINSRRQGSGCPYCAGQKPTTERNFATAYPELLNEIDWEKNKNFDPYKLTPRANQKIWWKCEKGHSWEATITNKTRKGYNGDCPYCLNRKLCDDNSLAHVRPDIAKDWHPTKNEQLTPKDVIAGGSKKVWWICKHNHEWKTTVGARVNNGTGCPKCSLQTSRIEIAIYSEVKALFDDVLWQEKIDGYECDILIKEKNIGIEVDGVYWHNRRPEVDSIKQKLFEDKGVLLFRLREEGLPLLSERDINFKWSDNSFPIIKLLINQILKFAIISEEDLLKLEKYVSNNTLINEKLYREIVSFLPAPPAEQSLAAKRPDLAKEWAFDLNAPLLPEHFKPGSSKIVWWRCLQGHTWKTSLNHRSNQNTGCPTCPKPYTSRASSEWNLASINPELASEWNFEKNENIGPDGLTPKSNIKVWWRCSKGHEWKTSLSSRSKGTGCPYCYGRFASNENNLEALYPEILSEWDYDLNKDLNPSDFTPHVNKKVWWRCSKIKDHKWQATIYNRTKNKSGCPHCAKIASRKYSIDFFHKFAEDRGGKCLSEKYVNCRQKIKMICINGHEWEARADNFLYEQAWCTVCKKGT